MIPKPDALSEHFFDAQQGLIYTEHEFASSDVKRALKLQAIEFETAQRKENDKIDIKMNAAAKSHKDELERERTLAEHKLQEMFSQKQHTWRTGVTATDTLDAATAFVKIKTALAL